MFLRCVFLLAALAYLQPLSATHGSLVIVGGGLSPDNADIYHAFIDKSAGGSIAIVPSASGEPQASADVFATNLLRHGVDRRRIEIVRLAERDDPATPGIDESTWASGASDADETAKIIRAGGIWFTGGDQARTMRLLFDVDGESLMLRAIRNRIRAGAVIGGTSAGAAIMGSTMIACGDPGRARTDEVSISVADCAFEEGRSPPLVLTKGMGFLTGHVVDQHFSERGRLPRLLRAVACDAGNGIGIDEDTAIVVDLARGRAQVLGRGGVTIITAPKPSAGCDPTTLSDIAIERHRAPDRIDLTASRAK